MSFFVTSSCHRDISIKLCPVIFCNISRNSQKVFDKNRIPVLSLFSFFDFFLKRTSEMKSAQSSLLTRCHLIWRGVGQRVRDYENSMLTLAKELSLHHLTHPLPKS